MRRFLAAFHLLLFGTFPALAQEVMQERAVLYIFKPGYQTFLNDRIERMVKETVRDNFADETATGYLEVKELDLTLPETLPFVRKYHLSRGSLSLLIVSMRNFKTVRWQKYDKIWKYANLQETELRRYLVRTTRNFLQEKN